MVPTSPDVSKTEVPVVVSIGTRTMNMREILALKSGSIIELNASVDEPLEVRVGQVAFFQGWAAWVAGQYGVVISQHVQPAPTPEVNVADDSGDADSEPPGTPEPPQDSGDDLSALADMLLSGQ